MQKYGENIGRNLLAQPSVENIKSAARAKKQKIDCEKELLKSVAEDENRVRSAKKNLKDCEADFRHWALGQSCEIYERVVAATEARLSVMKEPGGC